jgi:threonine synthase
MDKFLGFRCSLCGTEYGPREITYICARDGGNLDVILDFEALKTKYQPADVLSRSDASMWRYLPMLPIAAVPEGETPLHAAGGTPVYRLPALARQANLKNLWLKDESRNPTASFKDRASALVVARAAEIGAETVVTASTGNAGAALAGMAAAVGANAVVLAPRTAPPAKIAQLLIFGAKVILVDGSYDQAFDLSVAASDAFGWYCRNTGYNPFTAEGKKTAAFEIWGWWQAETARLRKLAGSGSDPRRLTIVVSVGDGNIISGIHKGFKDLLALGWIDVVPRLIGVQATGSAAVANAFRDHTEQITPVTAKTLADSISVDMPRDGVRAVRAARETGGAYVMVGDDEILGAIASLGKVGVFAEPAGAAAYAGLLRATGDGVVGEEDPVLVLNTGSGLKDVKAAMRAAGEAPVIEPSLAALKQTLQTGQ